ncbi:Uncharacterized protein OBRU01_02820 [Operophtera brumata]|uniref:C2H2-type domain-containing protein n=1 Tax=Operophtera brumata TaxID=104452 RepID=A0A0L7LR70_OPEBR|nr:Uncharacterized protein OBRU01_02820 [Operophtera brumata]
MDNSSAVSSTLPSRDYHCKVCDLFLDSVDSLEVHLQYHKENLYVKWGTQNSQNDTENNNGAKVKIETTVSAPADSSDNMITKPSPEFQQRATPDTSQFPHPATPQSYHSAPSPYQNPDQTTFSPGAQFGNSYSHSSFSQNQHSDQINWEQSQYTQEYHHHKPNRFHPYNMQDRASRVSSSSPLYGQPLNQPTPSPSPNQCDKCGFVCDSAVQLNEHCNSAHAGGGANQSSGPMPFQQFTGKQYNNSGYQNDSLKIKEEQEESSDILDLDSQKVVYPGNEGETPNSAYEEAHSQGREVNSRSVPMMPWEAQKLYSNPQLNGEVALFKEQKMFSEQKPYSPESKMFHPEQKFPYSQEKFLGVHHDQKPFMHVEQKIYPGVQMPPLSDYSGPLAASNADMKPPYRPYDSPAPPQISNSQPANATSSNLPPIGGKGANWKSNEARRPKTYNCTACNKWFTSSGHLKRHYNTTLHKNAVRSSGQPDPATMPISSHHHPSRDPIPGRGQQHSADSNTQSPVPSDDGRSVDDASLQSPYASHRVAAMQSKSPYTHLQGNLDNNYINNPLANHPLQHQVGSHPLNIGSQPPGLGLPSDSSHQGTKALTTAGNPPNGEAGPSVSQNHHMRGLLSVSTSNISTPALTQSSPALTPHTLPPFSHLGVNPYSPRSSDPLGTTVPDPTHTPLYLGQNFQQTIAPSYPNGMAPHVMDMAINNLPIASLASFGENSSEEVDVLEQERSRQTTGGRLPSFAQLQTQSFSVYVSNYITQPNVGGQVVADESTAGYIIVDPVHSPLQYSNTEIGGQSLGYDISVSPKNMKQSVVTYSPEHVKLYPYGYAVGGKTIKREEDAHRSDSSVFQILEIEDIMDYANKENYGSQMKSPASPESAKAEHESHSAVSSTSSSLTVSSPSAVTSTVPSSPLTERNQLKKSAPNTVHKCYECDKLFNKACYLTQHNKTFHSGAKPFKCDRCGKRFSDDVSYEGHYYKHTDNKPFKCSECPKSFNHKTDLRRHMCLHSGCKPFACDHCGKGFIRKDHMVKHFDTHFKKNSRSSASTASVTSTTSTSPSSTVNLT